MRRTLLLSLLGALAFATPAQSAAKPQTISGLRDARYCEVLELKGAPPSATITVWNTIGLNACPAKQWDALDAKAIAEQFGDTLALLNGPRHWVIDGVRGNVGKTVRSFGSLKMRQAATIPIKTAEELVQAPYTDRIIARNNSWLFEKGRTVFELVAPGGDTYVMQSYSQIKDPSLTYAQLARLGKRLKLPTGWRYRSRKLTKPLALKARGTATITQDELQNTYQLATTTRRGPRKQHAVKVRGTTVTVPGQPAGTVEDRGTLSGTPFGNGTLVLNGTFGAATVSGTVRLTFADGSVLGRFSMGFTIAEGMIDFTGTTRLVAGTGAYRGITSGELTTTDRNTLDGQNGVVTVDGSATY